MISAVRDPRRPNKSWSYPPEWPWPPRVWRSRDCPQLRYLIGWVRYSVRGGSEISPTHSHIGSGPLPNRQNAFWWAQLSNKKSVQTKARIEKIPLPVILTYSYTSLCWCRMYLKQSRGKESSTCFPVVYILVTERGNLIDESQGRIEKNLLK